MLRKRLARITNSDYVADCYEAYRARHGRFRMEDVVRWSLEKGDLPSDVRIDPVAHWTRVFKQVARTRRFRDKEGRVVRELLPAKIERVDANGNRYFDVVWDYLHQMSLDHALMAFSQRDENFGKQRRAATRDLQSALDNNPNLAGCGAQFQFAFMQEEPVAVVVETISESPAQEPPSVDSPGTEQTRLISRKKPR